MKRLFSLFMSAVMTVSVLSTASFTASANTKATAVSIAENQSYSTSVCGTVEENVKSWVKFDCAEAGLYDLTCTGNNAPDGVLQITVYDSYNKVINFAVNTKGVNPYSAVTYLNAGDSYYFCVEINGSLYDFDVSIKRHSHRFTISQQCRAVADDDAEIRRNGFTRITCDSCGEYYDTDVRAYPASIVLSKEKYTYDGTGKYPAVAVYDCNSSIIPSSEYTVLYEDNILTGKAFVTVTFNSSLYEGEMTRSFYIIPKKQSVTYLNSKKSKSITVKWTKDNNASGYELQYSTSPKFYKSKTKTVIVTKKTTVSKTIQKLTGNKKYYVRVRSYKTVGSVKLYGSWGTMADKKYVKTKK
ncbi:MAG: fibronectin type III domain-containing protein [Eubacterium sp.]